MAGAITLINEEILESICRERKEGFTLNQCYKKHHLNCALQTLCNRILVYKLLPKLEYETKQTIRNSLFPKWLDERVKIQDFSEHLYCGDFPFGFWA